MTIHEALQQYWGFSSFRPMQEDIIQSVLQGHDTLALLPTGGGKSLCYQVPAMVSEGTCLVVSPLVALMKDQVMRLRSMGIKAEFLVGGMNRYEVDVVLNNCVWGNVKLLYVSPERLQSRQFIEHYKQMRLSLIAVDEAHCISQWGYDFRPPYRQISDIRQFHPRVPVVALTASATPEVANDIRQQLLFGKDCRTFTQSFARPNINFLFYKESNKMNHLLRIVRGVGGCSIVYVRNRRMTVEVARALTAQGISATYYHAGLSQRERDQRQHLWLQSRQGVMVATNAFGMGIDRGDVRLVVHLDIPSSIEAYYQEAGRAGRDGQKSFAVLLYDDSNLSSLDKSVDIEYPTPIMIKNVYRAVCNFYQIPVGSGCDERFDFDLESFCRTYGFNPVPTYNAFRFLERMGLASLPERNNLYSRLFIPMGKDDVYRFQVENRKLGDILTGLLRMYGGLFTDFTDIDEGNVARRLKISEKTVSNALLQMDKLDVVVYRPKATKPQILFLSSRVDVDALHFNDEEYRHMKSLAQQRVAAMKQMVMSDSQCRSLMMRKYFGESDVEPCGVCDVCRAEKAKESPATMAPLREAVCSLLERSPRMAIDKIASDLHQYDTSKVAEVLRELMDEGLVRQNDDFTLSLCR